MELTREDGWFLTDKHCVCGKCGCHFSSIDLTLLLEVSTLDNICFFGRSF